MSGSAGFSLILMSIVVTVGAMIMVSFLPGKEAGDTNAKAIDDIHKLETVEEHMRSFMAYNRRRPCPADGQYPENSSNFGREAAIAGTCQGGTPNAPLGPDPTGNIVAGTIPTRSIGLDTSYAFDSYGRPFTYVVDKRATTTGSCDALEGITTGSTTPTGKGGLYIDDIAGNQIDQVMYAYISYGPSGYGAWPDQGSATTLTAAQSAARRINSGSTNLAMQMDAAVAPGANPGASTFVPDLINTLVRNSMTLPSTTGGLDTGFDDLVWYREDLKNTCCLGKKCIPLGFRVDGQSGTTSTQKPVVLAVGDINCDGYPDLVVGPTPGGGAVYVIFGTSNMGNSSNSPWPIPPIGFDPSQVNGKNGFYVTGGGNFNTAATIGSLSGITSNGKPCNDLVLSVQDGYAYVIFGGPMDSGGYWLPLKNSATGHLNASNLAGYNTNYNGTSGFIIKQHGTAGGIFANAGSNFIPNKFAIGQIDDSTYPALIAIGTANSGTSSSGYVIYGKPLSGNGPNGANDNWTNTASINAALLDGSTGTSLNPGFQFYSSNTHLMVGSTATTTMNGVVGDFDEDGYGDIEISDSTDTAYYAANPFGVPASPQTRAGEVYLIYGRKRTDWANSFTTVNLDNYVVDLAAELNNSTGTHCSAAIAPSHYNNCATLFYYYNNPSPIGSFGEEAFVADLNADGHPDLLISGHGQTMTTGIYAQSSRWGTIQNVYKIPAGVTGFYYAHTANPSWATSCSSSASNCPIASAYDVDGSGSLSLLLSYDSVSGPLSRSNSGVTLVFRPSGGWTSGASYNYVNWTWSGTSTNGFQIDGPIANSVCGTTSAVAGDVRTGDGGAPEIIISCPGYGENSYGSVYGLYKNKGWPSSIDLSQLN